MVNRIETGSTEPISIYALTIASEAATGLTNLYVRLMRGNGDFLDWNDATFKASGWTTLNQLLTEVDATNAAGIYEVTGGLDTSAITNPTADDEYTVYPYKSAGTTILPGPATINVGKWVDDIGTILTDTDEIQGKLPTNNIMGSSDKTDKDDDIDAILVDTNAIDARLPSDPADESLQQASHAQTQSDIAALNDPTVGAIADQVWDETLSGHTIVGSSGEAQGRLDNIQAQTDLLPADPASESNIDANEVKIDAVQTDVTAILADTAAIDARLPSDPADESLQQAAHTQTQADIAALDDLSAIEVENAVWDATQASHVGVGTTGESLDDASSGGSAPSVPDIVNGVWDEVLAGHVTIGTTGHALDEAGGASSVTPGAVADAVWDENHASHTVSGSVAETLQNVKDRVG